MNIDNNGNIVFANNLPIKIGDSNGLLPGLEKLYYQSPGFKYFWAWAKQIPWVSVVQWPDSTYEIYSEVPLNDSKWNKFVLNFDSNLKVKTFEYTINGESYIPKTLTFIKYPLLDVIAERMFQIYGTLNNVSSSIFKSTVNDNFKMYTPYEQVGLQDNTRFNTIKYLNEVNKKPGVGNALFQSWLASRMYKMGATKGINITPWNDSTGWTVNLSPADLVKWLSSRGINTTDKSTFPVNQFFDVKGFIQQTTPPVTTTSVTTPPVTTTSVTTPPVTTTSLTTPPAISPATTPPATTPPAISPATTPPALSPATTPPAISPATVPYNWLGRERMLSRRTTEPRPLMGNVPGQLPGTPYIPKIDLNQPVGMTPLSEGTKVSGDQEIGKITLDDWISSRSPIESAIAVTTTLPPPVIIPGKNGDSSQPLMPIVRENKEGSIKGINPPDRGIYFPIGNYQWGKQFDVPVREPKIDSTKYCGIGTNCYGSQFEKLPDLWWFK